MNDLNMQLFGQDLFGNPIEQQHKSVLYKQFIHPPFTVLDARQGYWQERKRAWLSLGIKSELGREEGITWGESDAMTSPSLNPDSDLEKARQSKVKSNLANPRDDRSVDWPKAGEVKDTTSEHRTVKRHSYDITGRPDYFQQSAQTGTSIFDPVLCELMYTWFCPEGGLILDPFAGGSVRGIVATSLNRYYMGIELRPEQIVANQEQANQICKEHKPEWIEGDAANLDVLVDEAKFDFVFSCPPYGNLEIYSDDTRDISNMSHEDFLSVYQTIIHKSLDALKPDRFACFVVGDFRGPDGNYRQFVADTIKTFAEWGGQLYNEAILITQVGSAPIRARNAYKASRKLCKTHQNVLIFVKGDAKRATKFIESANQLSE